MSSSGGVADEAGVGLHGEVFDLEGQKEDVAGEQLLLGPDAPIGPVGRADVLDLQGGGGPGGQGQQPQGGHKRFPHGDTVLTDLTT